MGDRDENKSVQGIVLRLSYSNFELKTKFISSFLIKIFK